MCFSVYNGGCFSCRYRAIAPRPLTGEPVKTEDSSKTPQGSGSSCSGRETLQQEGLEKKGKSSLKRAADAGERPAKRVKRTDGQGK
jgi:hypothetical protein